MSAAVCLPLNIDSPLVFSFAVEPGPPDSLKAKPKEGQIVLSWKSPKNDGWSEIKKYHIYKSEDGGPKVPLDTLDANFNSYNVQDLSPNKQYYFEVVAENGVGCGEPAKTDKPASVQGEKKGWFVFLYAFFWFKCIIENF